MMNEARRDLDGKSNDKITFYRELAQQLGGLLGDERDAVANAANTAALLFTNLPDLNWAGFYFLRSAEELVLGPFQGKPACVRIAVGRGVCGAAIVQRRSILVGDVHAFAVISSVTPPPARSWWCR